MANEFTMSAVLSGYKSTAMTAALAASRTDVNFNWTGNVSIDVTVSVGTSIEAIPLGDITSPGFCFLQNFDSTNYVSIRNGSGGANVAKLRAGGFALFEFDNAAIPFWIANTAACLCRAVIFQV